MVNTGNPVEFSTGEVSWILQVRTLLWIRWNTDIVDTSIRRTSTCTLNPRTWILFLLLVEFLASGFDPLFFFSDNFLTWLGKLMALVFRDAENGRQQPPYDHGWHCAYCVTPWMASLVLFPFGGKVKGLSRLKIWAIALGTVNFGGLWRAWLPSEN